MTRPKTLSLEKFRTMVSDAAKIQDDQDLRLLLSNGLELPQEQDQLTLDEVVDMSAGMVV